jgi:hypothetical protein
MRSPTLRSTIAIAATALVAACGDSTAPAVPAGTFTLRSIDGQPLPALVAEGRTSREYTDAMTLVIGSGLDTLRVRYHLVTLSATGDEGAPLELADAATVDARPDRLCVRLEIPGQSSCEGPVWVRRSRDEVVVRLFPGIHPAADGEYRFVREGR